MATEKKLTSLILEIKAFELMQSGYRHSCRCWALNEGLSSSY